MKSNPNRLTRSAAVLAIAAALGACSPVPTEPESMPFSVPGAQISVTPTAGGCSPEGAYTADVAWALDAGIAPTIEIQVGLERKVFARSDEASGSEPTGAWVSPGMRFYLLDRESDRLLAAVEAGPGRCPPAGPVPPEEPAAPAAP